MKSLRIAWHLLWANRWLWLLLVLWPWVLAAILLLDAGAYLAADDVEGAMQQQAVYGLALVAFAGGALLGAEQRSRRIAMVLARAVSRRQYLAALWLTAFLPLVVYVADLMLTGMLLHAPEATLRQTAGALLMLGGITASLAVLFSLALPGVVAGLLSLGAVSAPLLWSPPWHFALAGLLQVLLTGALSERQSATFCAGLVECAVSAALLFEVAVRLFERRDLRLKSE